MWIPLTPDTLLAALSGREAAALRSAALGDNQDDALDDIAANVALEWRGGLRRLTVVDARAGYVPDELIVHILADYRYRAFTRLPGLADLLDEHRVEEWRRANKVRDNLGRVAIAAPDAEHAETGESSGKAGPSIADPDEESLLGW